MFKKLLYKLAQRTLLCCLVLACSHHPLRAVTYEFSGMGLWTSPANWNPSLPPVFPNANDEIIITTGSVCILSNYTQLLPGTLVVRPNASLLISTTGVLQTMPGAIVNDGTLRIDGQLTLAASSTVSSTGLLEIDATLTVGASSTVSNSGTTHLYDQGFLVFNGGTPHELPGSTFIWDAGGKVENTDAPLTVNTALQIPAGGHLVNLGSGVTQFNAPVTNNGLIQNGGSLKFFNAFTNNAQIDALAGGVNIYYGNSVNNGTLFSDGGISNHVVVGVLDQQGTIINNGIVAIDEGGRLRIRPGPPTPSLISGTFLLLDGILEIEDGVNVSTLQNLTIFSDGAVQVDPGATLTVQHTIQNSGTFNNAGTVHLQHTVQNSGTFNNAGTVHLQRPFNNSGLFNQTGGVTNVNDRFNQKSGGTFGCTGGQFRLFDTLSLQALNLRLPCSNVFDWQPGGLVEVVNNGSLLLDAPTTLPAGRKLDLVAGTATVSSTVVSNATLTVGNSCTLTNNGTFTNNGSMLTQSSSQVRNFGLWNQAGALTNNGTFHLDTGGELRFFGANSTLPGGTFNWKTGSTVSVGAGGGLDLPTALSLGLGRTLRVLAGGLLRNASLLTVTGTVVNDGTVLNNGSILKQGTLVNNGVYGGNGGFVGFFTNETTGTIAPGNSPGCTSFGNGVLNKGKVRIELGGTTECTEFDRFAVSELVDLGGSTLEVVLVNGFTPTVGQSFSLVLAEQVNGTFGNVVLPPGVTASVSYLATEVRLNILTVLPVELTRFEAQRVGDEVLLHWQTASERNNEGFVVERSADALHWHDLAFVPGRGTGTGLQEYSLNDYTPLPGLNYYRLRQTDTDGTETYSPIVSVTLPDDGSEMVRVYPNPATQVLWVESTKGREITGDLYHLDGRWMGALNAANSLDVKALAAGCYLLRLTETESGRVVVQRVQVLH